MDPRIPVSELPRELSEAMARFAILCPDAGGHLYPMGCLGAELCRRGHEVTLLARERAALIAGKLRLPLREIPINDGPRYRRLPWPARAVGRFTGSHSLLEMRRRLRHQSELMLELAPSALKEMGVDGLIVDQNVLGGGYGGGTPGCPFRNGVFGGALDSRPCHATPFHRVALWRRWFV